MTLSTERIARSSASHPWRTVLIWMATIVVDATVIRSILVPATMRLLGDWNWYLPGFLSWIPDVRVEVTETRRAPAGAQENEKS